MPRSHCCSRLALLHPMHMRGGLSCADAAVHGTESARACRALRFRIDIVNPGVQTASNFWTMTLLDHFAQPIPSFNLWAFPEISISTFARNSAPSCYLGDCVGAGAGVAIPVSVTLRTQNVVSTSGQLYITAPLEFGFDPIPNAPLIEGDKQTPCLIREYDNHNMSALPYTWRMAEPVAEAICNICIIFPLSMLQKTLSTPLLTNEPRSGTA